MSRGTYTYPPKPSMRLITDVFAYAAREMPRWNTISISGYHIREAGATAVQEVAFTLADGIAYVEAALEAGLDVNEFGTQLSFFFNVHNHFLEEIAKFRAARRLWARIMRERFQATAPRAQMLRFHAQTAGSTLTAQQPDNNIVRVALQALAAVLGGCQSLHTNSRDEALALPTEESVKVALRTQQIIGAETGVTKTVDPVGGSYYIEYLNQTIEEEFEKYLKKIHRMGGALAAVEKGFFQDEIRKNAYRLKKEVDSAERIIVGVNKFQDKEDLEPKISMLDNEIETRQVARLKDFKINRDKIKTDAAISALQKAAEDTNENLMPHLINAVKSNVTLGEINNVFKEVFGVFEPKIAF